MPPGEKRILAGRWLIATAAALALSVGSGCAAIKATQQPGKKNLTVLREGTPRSHVIAELGPPLWSEDREGHTVDVFAFKQGYTKTVKAGRALVHGAADVMTAGLWEVVGIPAESLADGADVKVEVSYDARRAVHKIDVIEGQHVIAPRRWPFGRKTKPDGVVFDSEPVGDQPAEKPGESTNAKASAVTVPQDVETGGPAAGGLTAGGQ